MGLSRLSKRCRSCPYVNTCKHKRMEALGYMPLPIAAQATMSTVSDVTMPALIKHDYRDIKIAEGTTVTIDLEELKEQMRKSCYPDYFQSAT